MSEDSLFKEVAEAKVEKEIGQEANLILGQFHMTKFALRELSKDKGMTNRAWTRVLDNLDKIEQGLTPSYKSQIEEQVTKALRNRMGLMVQMAIKTEGAFEATKREMAAAQAAMQEKMKALKEAQDAEAAAEAEKFKKD